MAEKHRVEVDILGQKYTIRSEAPPEYVRELAAYVEKRAREIGGASPGQDPVKVLALAALYIADELFRTREERAEGDQERTAADKARATAEKDAVARLGALRQLLDSVVPEP
ncbi:MAG TPA: cell division protein ZapA [Methylomirabilota bacterium]|nr:cell division protein ZapA [Methylomirabilota bacterium]